MLVNVCITINALLLVVCVEPREMGKLCRRFTDSSPNTFTVRGFWDTLELIDR